MKKIFLIFLAGLAAFSCSFFVTQGIHDVIQPFGEFTLLHIVSERDAQEVDKFLFGDAGNIKEFGADSCIVAKYRYGRETYTVEAISFLNEKRALGAFTMTDIVGSAPVELDFPARKSAKVMQFVKGRCLVTVLGDMAGAYDLATGLAKRIHASRIRPDIYEGLPQMNLVEQSGFYFAGPKVFVERFSPELARILKLKNAREGIAAQYRTEYGNVDFVQIRFHSREESLEAVNSYLKYRSDCPIILPQEKLQLYIIILPDRSEVYIAEYGEWMYIMLGSSHSGNGRELFEYILRGGK